MDTPDLFTLYALSVAGEARGKVNQKVDPLPLTLSTPTSPLCPSITVLLIYKPKPSPGLKPF